VLGLLDVFMIILLLSFRRIFRDNCSRFLLAGCFSSHLPTLHDSQFY